MKPLCFLHENGNNYYEFKMKHLNWNEIIDQNTQLVRELFSNLNEEQLNLQPNLSTWSITQNLAHLIVINESYFPILTELLTLLKK